MSYKMPDVTIGEVVLWFPDAQRSDVPFPAVVNRIYPKLRRIDVCVFASGTYGSKPYDGVHHVDDPQAEVENKADPGNRPGSWDVTPWRKTVDEMNERLRDVMGMQGKVNKVIDTQKRIEADGSYKELIGAAELRLTEWVESYVKDQFEQTPYESLIPLRDNIRALTGTVKMLADAMQEQLAGHQGKAKELLKEVEVKHGPQEATV